MPKPKSWELQDRWSIRSIVRASRITLFWRAPPIRPKRPARSWAANLTSERLYSRGEKTFLRANKLKSAGDPRTDLVPLCSNCRSMAHHGPGGTIILVDELKKILEEQRRHNARSR